MLVLQNRLDGGWADPGRKDPPAADFATGRAQNIAKIANIAKMANINVR